MKIAAASVEEYMAKLPVDRRDALGNVRVLIQRIWPRIKVDLAYDMPTFHLDGQALCAIANQKNFMALYVMHHDLLIAFKNDLKVRDTGKSCIRFKRLDPELLDLFDRIIKYTGSQMSTSILYGRTERPIRNGKAH